MQLVSFFTINVLVIVIVIDKCSCVDSYPEEVVSQGEAAVQIYLTSCNEGSAVTVFLRIDVVGRDGVGKTSLTKSLTLQTFNPYELSTRGVVFDPNCQIIVKESCDWTTPLTREDYRDIYDKNITAIMVESFDNPKVRDEYLSSKVEHRPMQLKKLEDDSIESVKYKAEQAFLIPETVSLAETSPSLDSAIHKMDPVVAVADVANFDSNSEGIKDRRKAKEDVLQLGSPSSSQISPDDCASIMAEALDKPEMRKEYLSSKVEERPMQLNLANNISSKIQDESSLGETVSLIEASPSLDLAIPRVALAADDAVTVDDNSENISSRKELVQREIANSVTEITTEKNDGGTTLGKFMSAVWSKLTGFRKKKKQSSSKKQVPCASHGTASESLEETKSVNSTQRLQTSSTMPLLPTFIDFPATQPLLPVDIHSEDATSVASAKELLEQQSKQPDVTTQMDPPGLGVQSSTYCSPPLISELKLETDKVRLVNHKAQEALELPQTVLLARSAPLMALANQRMDQVGAVADAATFDDNSESIGNRRKANDNILQLRSTSFTERPLVAGCMPVTGIFPGNASDVLRKLTSSNGTKIPTSSTISSSTISSVETSVDHATEQVGGIHSGAATSVVSAQDLLEQMRSQAQVTSQANSLSFDVQSSSSLPSIPESTKKRVTEMLRNRETRAKVKDEMIVTVLDYAGQNVFYATHQLCLSKEGFYYVVFNASLSLDAITPSVFRIREGEVVHISLPHDETNYDRLEEWISAIHIMEFSHSRRIILFEKVGIRSPAVFLVGTHADELKDQPGMLERQEAFLRNKLEGTVLSEHIVWASKDRMCFYVDNTVTNPQSGTVDEQVVLLRQKTEEVARQVAQHHRLPITWLKFEEEVREVKETDKTKKTASVEEMMQIAMKAAGIKSKEELFVLLNYLSNRSVLLYHPLALKCAEAKEVVLDVEWLISQLEKVITVQTDVPAMFKNAVIRSSEKGIMTVELIKHLLKDSGSARYLIMSLMNQFDLLCEYAALEDLKQADDERDYVNLSGFKHQSSAQDIDDYDACFIPCLLHRPTTLQSMMVAVEFKTPYLLLSSGCLRMPRPLFYRLLTRLCNRFRRLPQLFQNAGYFHVYHNHKLEIVLNRYSLQMSILTTNKTAPEPAVCFLVQGFVVHEVNEAKQLAMAGLELELGFMHKVTVGAFSETAEEFVSLEGYPSKRKAVHVTSIDVDISLPTEMKVWFSYHDEVCAKKLVLVHIQQR